MKALKIPTCEATDFGKFIRELRRINQITAQELARQMIIRRGIDPREDLMWISSLQWKIYSWENGNSDPKVYDLVMVAQTLEVELDFFTPFFMA